MLARPLSTEDQNYGEKLPFRMQASAFFDPLENIRSRVDLFPDENSQYRETATAAKRSGRAIPPLFHKERGTRERLLE
jgi:hypothetical protein